MPATPPHPALPFPLEPINVGTLTLSFLDDQPDEDGNVVAIWIDRETGECREQLVETSSFVRNRQTVINRMARCRADRQVPQTLLYR